MKRKTGGPLVVIKVEFLPDKDYGEKLKRVFRLLLTQHGDSEEPNHNCSTDSQIKEKGVTQ